MASIGNILSEAGLTRPDGRPLYRYPLAPEIFSGIEAALRDRVASGKGIDTAAPVFVFWASEHIRARFRGGPLKWDFVLRPLGLPPDDRTLGIRLAERGLRWWRRGVTESNAGVRMFLYSLMAEGGIPEALLKRPGLYRDVVMGLLVEIETEGGPDVAPWAGEIASRWTARLPQMFRNADIARLLADLAVSLVELRTALPDDLPEAAAERWLDGNRPDWRATIPLRMTGEIAESLVRPALRAERDARSLVAGPLCGRELRRVETGRWRDYLVLESDGWLPERFFRDARGMRLRLLPTGSGSFKGLRYSATPEEGGWRLRRFGGAAKAAEPFPLEDSFALAAFADGRPTGEAVVDPGVPLPAEAPGFWRAADRNEGADADRLVPLSGGGRTRAPCLWLLAPENAEPEADAGLTLEAAGTAPRGRLWRVSGKGSIRLDGRRYRVETGADDDTPQARLLVFGELFHGWRLDSRVPIYRGDVDIHGQRGAAAPRCIPKGEIRLRKGRGLGDEIVEWVQDDEVLTSCRIVRLPSDMHLKLREEAAGRLAFTAEGLATGWRVHLRAGKVATEGAPENGAMELALETPGAAPGLVRLRLSEPKTGRSLALQAAWPARRGMILDPEGARLTGNRSVAVRELGGWRTVAPEGAGGDLELQLAGCRPISVPAAGEVSLASAIPRIEEMLAQGGPDAQVNLCLVVSGDQGRRLEIRRRLDPATVEDGSPRAKSFQEDRIEDYAANWRLLVSIPGNPEWDSFWPSISIARQGGDAGATERVQALAKAPEAAILLALRVPVKHLSEVLGLDSEIPIFWPTLAVSDFCEAMKIERVRLREKLEQYFEGREAETEAGAALARRVEEILTRRPELAGHFCKAMLDNGLIAQVVKDPDRAELLKSLLIPDPEIRLAALAQEAAQRFDRLPQGVRGLEPPDRPEGLPSFDRHVQLLIDAPLVVAEMAAGRRPAPEVREKIILINLRLVDPLYFDAALPAALILYLSDSRR